MPFCSHCGKEVSEDVSFCPSCGERLRIGDKNETHGRKRRKVISLFVGLIVVGAICGGLILAEHASLPEELRVEIAQWRVYRALPYEVQVGIARDQGVTVEKLLASPYDA
jgi:hypothetical protein